jgi:hypothetical protein
VKCDLPQFRVDKVDDAVWNWMSLSLRTPFNATGLLAYQTEKSESHHLLERLKLMEDLLEKTILN